MHFLTSWFIRNPVAANLAMAFILIAGLLGVQNMRIEGFPKIPPDSINIVIGYPGANAQQVDEGVAQKIEKALEGLPGAKRMYSFSADSSAQVTVQKNTGYPLDKLLEDIKIRIDAIATFPQSAERPVITRDAFKFAALIVQVYGDVDTDVLQRMSRNIKNTLLSQPEISKIRSWGQKEAEISIALNPEKLESYDLSYPEIAEKINQNSLLSLTGSLTTKSGNISVRADKQAYQWRDFADIVILERNDGTVIRLEDIAIIQDTFVEEDSMVRYQGKPAIGMEVVIDGKGNLLEISKVTQQVIKQLQAQLPNDIAIDVWADQSGFVSDRLSLLQSNAVQGLLIVFVILSLFLNFKLAFWVAMGIPVSISGTLWLMGWDQLDYSLNDITTFGMIVVLGILVDDAIVVGESVYSEREKQSDPIIGTENGVRKVATATIFGALTSIAAFYPMLLIENPIGKVLAGFSGVVIIALMFSLFESKFILPAHLASVNMGKPKTRLGILWNRLRTWVDNKLNHVNQRWYRPLLRKAIKYRYASFIFFLSLALVGISLATSGKVRTTFFPEVPGSIITVKVELDPLIPYALTTQHAAFIEQQAQILNTEIQEEFPNSKPVIARIMTAVNNANEVEIYAELAPEKQRVVDTLELVKRWRNKVPELEGVVFIDFSGSEETAGGFALTLYSKNVDSLKFGVEELSAKLSSIKGVADIRDDLKGGEPEIFAILKPEAARWGVTTEQLSTFLANHYGSLEVQRFQRFGNEVKVQLSNEKDWRNSIDDLTNSRIKTNKGEWIPISAVADFESRYVSGIIWRRNGNRAAVVYADIDKKIISTKDVVQILEATTFKELKTADPELDIQLSGELEQSEEIKGDLKTALLLVLFLIYILLAIPLKSYSKPMIIMSVIPFGIAGAITGHLIMGIPLSILSFFGILSLTGIVVNDSLVMLTTYNQLLSDGMPKEQALEEAGASRFRAIFLTTVTTVSGLMPLMMETSEQAQYLIPAAVSLVYGELFATVITLFIVPIMTLILAEILQLLSFKSKQAENDFKSEQM
ncbi:efflux RND transporter permease subunit [Marinomonas sp. S3726]|uniref:efflux RND transporter permease subunit n=1 Tax=Marinomonas sp. S3726 TaxID=579484 RepID=UPI0005FA5347|nr:efflux RND transporter permease subunit [Marinomonas sp. S3726]